MPTDRHATVYVELLDLDEVKEILRALTTENRLLRDALQQAHECCARPGDLIDGGGSDV